jgi:hypothetical protein
MKKIMYSFVAVCLCFAILGGAICSAAESSVSSRLTDLMQATSTFEINSDGQAYIFASYNAYEDVVSYVDINITLEKKFLLLFWKDVDSWSFQSSSMNYATDMIIDVGSGTHKATFEFVVHHLDGTSNTYTEEITDSK